ncbi:unnamed protein product [Withania somnifera]
MGFECAKNDSILSKVATNEQHGENSPYFDGWKAYDSDPFHPVKNPNGVIQMGLAENQLCSDLIEDWIKRNPKASICTPEGIKSFKAIANFQDYHGLPEFRRAIAKFMEKTRGGRVTFDPERVVMAGGATGANETIIFCLADPGDAFLVPSPYYPAFNRDLRWRTGVQLIPIHCESFNNFKITAKAVKEAFEKAQNSNINVKGLILTNPSNPLGTTLDKDTLKSLFNFTNQHNLHLVCDEIYAATVFGTPQFVSIAEVLNDNDMIYCNKDFVHIVYSLSKDMGLPGFRIGIVYSFNDAVVNCARKMSSFGLVSTQTQHFLATMLSDEKFVTNFLAESGMRLAKRHKHFTNGLEEVGIKCLKSNAGLFCWMDLRPLLRESSLDSEMSLWRVIINEVKANNLDGSVCFANMTDEMMDIALARIRKFVVVKTSVDESLAMEKKQQWKKNNLRLSFSKRMYDESVLSPLSSPIPHSPLVR